MSMVNEIHKEFFERLNSTPNFPRALVEKLESLHAGNQLAVEERLREALEEEISRDEHNQDD